MLFKANVNYEGDLSTLLHRWVNGNIEMCPDATVPGDGIATCSYAFGDLGPQTVEVTVSGGSATTPAQARVDIEITVNQPPTIEITSPSAGQTFEPGSITLAAIVEDAEDPSEDLTVTVTSSIDGLLNTSAVPVSAGDWAEQVALSKGLHLLTFTVTDTGGKTGQATVVDVVVNTPPTTCVVTVDPDPAYSGEGLAAVLTSFSTDDDGDPVTYTYAWTYTPPLGSALPAGASPVVPSGVTVRDEFWEVTVTPFDNVPAAGVPCIASIVIDNSPPRIDTVALEPTTADTTDEVFAIPNGWYDQDGDPEVGGYRYEWHHNGSIDFTEVTATFPYAKTTRDDTVQVLVTPRDIYDDGVPVASPTITIANAPPGAPGVAINPQNPGDGDFLQCNINLGSTDPDAGDTVSYTYEWYRAGVIYGDTDNSIDPGDTSLGETWECRVVPSDGTDTGPYGFAIVAIVDGTAPDAPVIDPVERYRNEDYVDFTGSCEPAADLTFYCEDSTTSWSEAGVCTGGGDFTLTVFLTRGEDTACYATAEDSFGNESGPSPVVDTEVCATEDTYEVGSSGDTPGVAIDQWGLLADDASTTITIVGNVPNTTDADWYRIQTSDDNSANLSANRNDYRFRVEVTTGTVYAVVVYKGGSFGPTSAECPTAINIGYDDYDDFAQDQGLEGVHAAPLNERDCGPVNSPIYNECQDFSNTYYIEIIRDAALPLSCQAYELTITNGVWP